MPDGRTLQIGTVHNLGQNFAKAFDVTYETEKGERQHVWQTCYGISGRPIAGVLAMHGDDNGAVLPPTIAPVQVVVVPIPFKKMEKQINEACQDTASRLKKANISVEVDSREDLTPGSKYYYWELRGVPIRVEIGPRDLKQGVATVVRRDTLEKQTFKTETITEDIAKLMNTMTDNLREKAWQWMNAHVYRVNQFETAKKLLRKKAGIVEILWCGNPECGHKLEEEANTRVLGTPVDFEEKVSGNCVVCGKKAKEIMRTAIAY
jgi:prolyl-tRNA synthetase